MQEKRLQIKKHFMLVQRPTRTCSGMSVFTLSVFFYISRHSIIALKNAISGAHKKYPTNELSF